LKDLLSPFVFPKLQFPRLAGARVAETTENVGIGLIIGIFDDDHLEGLREKGETGGERREYGRGKKNNQRTCLNGPG
jgi:hypothetical protein